MRKLVCMALAAALTLTEAHALPEMGRAAREERRRSTHRTGRNCTA